MEEKEKENKNNAQEEITTTKGESLRKVVGAYVEPSEGDLPYLDALKKALSECNDGMSDKDKKELEETAKKVQEFMNQLTVTKAPVIKSAKKGKMKEALQSTIDSNKIEVSKESRESESESEREDNKEEKIQEI